MLRDADPGGVDLDPDPGGVDLDTDPTGRKTRIRILYLLISINIDISDSILYLWPIKVERKARF